MKAKLLTTLFFAGSLIGHLVGGFDPIFKALCLVMCVDYITGLLCAGVFKASTKSDGGALSSREHLKGLTKKVGMLLMVVTCYSMDVVIGCDYIRNGCIYALLANETLSIVENCGLMGIPIPEKLKQAIDVLKEG